MCFGNQVQSTQTQQYQADPRVAKAATQNLQDVSQLQKAGYTAYGGPRVADFSNLQQSGFDIGGAIAPSNPTAGQSYNLINSFANAGSPTVSADPIYSQMSPYMNQYVMQALAPQLEAQNQQFAQQNKQLDAAATSAGAFGDSRAGIEAANLTNQQNIGRTGLIGQAYNAAFNTAIGAGAQDVANRMAAQGQTGQFYEQGLQNQLAGANALTGLSGANLGYAGQAANLQEGLGGLQQQQAQANLNVPYSDYLAAQQYPFLTAQLMNSSIGTGSGALKGTTTTTTSQPDNSGYKVLGALGGTALNLALPGAGTALSAAGSAMGPSLGMAPAGGATGWTSAYSDKRLKENIHRVGTAPSGIPLKAFNFKHDPLKRPQVGFVAQDVEKQRPEAVSRHPVTGHKMVDYARAAAPRFEDAFGRAA